MIKEALKFQVSKDTLSFLKELGEMGAPISFDELLVGVAGIDGVEIDNPSDLRGFEKQVLLTLDEVGINEKTLNEFMANDNISKKTGLLIAQSINQLSYDDIMQFAEKVSYMNKDILFEEDELEADGIMPPRKAGYKRVLAVRNGKKVWINKRLPNKKVILTPAQKRALMKARLKAHKAGAEIKRKKSLQKRKIFNF